MITKVKNIVPSTRLLVILIVKKLMEHSIKNYCRKQTEKNLELKINQEKR